MKRAEFESKLYVSMTELSLTDVVADDGEIAYSSGWQFFAHDERKAVSDSLVKVGREKMSVYDMAIVYNSSKDPSCNADLAKLHRQRIEKAIDEISCHDRLYKKRTSIIPLVLITETGESFIVFAYNAIENPRLNVSLLFKSIEMANAKIRKENGTPISF